jgi:hypothetical protein
MSHWRTTGARSAFLDPSLRERLGSAALRRRRREEWERQVTARLDELERKFATMHVQLEDVGSRS